MIFRVCTVFGIRPKDVSSLMDLPLNFVQFFGYNLDYPKEKPALFDSVGFSAYIH